MKKIIFIFSILCILLCGCSLQDTSSYKAGDLSVYKYDETSVTFYRRLSSHKLYIYVDNINDEKPTINTVLLTMDGSVIAENYKEGIFKSDIELIKNKDKETLKVIERLTYYDKNDRPNNFTYDKYTDFKYIQLKTGFTIKSSEGTQDIKADVVNNIKSLIESSEVGLYNFYELSYVIGFFTYLICGLIGAYILYMMHKYILLKERKYHFEAYNNIFLLILLFLTFIILTFENEPQIIIVVLNFLLFIPVIIKLVILISRIKEAKDYELNKAERLENLDKYYHYYKTRE